jgi:hypothetical protein
MTWVCIPSTAWSSALASAPSDSESPELSPDTAPSLLRRSKPLRWPFSSRDRKTAPYLNSLSGTISRPSTAARGVESWISSLRATRASHSAWPASDSERTTLATCGHTLPASWEMCGLPWCSSKTSQLTLDLGLSKSGKTYSDWATDFNRSCSAPAISALLTNENGSSSSRGTESSTWTTPRAGETSDRASRRGHFSSLSAEVSTWPTPNVPNGGRVNSAADVAARGSTDRGKRQIDLGSVVRQWATPSAMVANDGEGPATWRARQQILKEKHINGNGAGVPLAIQAQEKAALWATPRSSDGEKGGPHQQFGAGGTPLPAQAVSLWATPASRDWRSGDASDATMERNARPLNEQTVHWDGPASRQAPTTETAGGPSSTSTPTSRLQLNERFVELLMGLPCGWTCVCAPALIGSED